MEEQNPEHCPNDLIEIRRNARNVLRIIVATALLVLTFLGVSVVLSGCEFVYLPECDTACTAGGGNDTYGRAQ